MREQRHKGSLSLEISSRSRRYNTLNGYCHFKASYNFVMENIGVNKNLGNFEVLTGYKSIK